MTPSRQYNLSRAPSFPSFSLHVARPCATSCVLTPAGISDDVGSKKFSLEKTIPDSFPDIDVLAFVHKRNSTLGCQCAALTLRPSGSASPTSPSLLTFASYISDEGSKTPSSTVLRALLWRQTRRLSLVLRVRLSEKPPRDAPGTPPKVLARHFSSMALWRVAMIMFAFFL